MSSDERSLQWYPFMHHLFDDLRHADKAIEIRHLTAFTAAVQPCVPAHVRPSAFRLDIMRRIRYIVMWLL
jgi:hypothetical protein